MKGRGRGGRRIGVDLDKAHGCRRDCCDVWDGVLGIVFGEIWKDMVSTGGFMAFLLYLIVNDMILWLKANDA